MVDFKKLLQHSRDRREARRAKVQHKPVEQISRVSIAAIHHEMADPIYLDQLLADVDKKHGPHA